MAHSLHQAFPSPSTAVPLSEPQRCRNTVSSIDKFVAEECVRQGLVPMSLVGTSEIEMDSTRAGEEAREKFKGMVRTKVPSGDGRAITNADKYAQRLVNNRRSAAASKVAQQIRMAYLSTWLRKLSKENDELKEMLFRQKLPTACMEVVDEGVGVQRQNEQGDGANGVFDGSPTWSSVTEQAHPGSRIGRADPGGENDMFVFPPFL